MFWRWIKRAVAAAVVVAIAAVTVYALWPASVLVDIARVDRGPLVVTIDAEGTASVRDLFRVSAPIAGTLERLPIHVGDPVEADVTTVAAIRPVAPSFLDVRTRREVEAAVEAAVAAVGLASAQLHAALSAERMAAGDRERAEQLSKGGTISARALQEAITNLDTAQATTEQARANLALRESELASVRARLIEPAERLPKAQDEMCCYVVAAPADGVVLKVIVESEQVVLPGAPLVEIGNPSDLEVVVPLLSSDAVATAVGAAATVTDWGGPPLRAKVRQINPAAYTKVSALGIEEQRVDAKLDLIATADVWKGLGHSFRVMAHIETWSAADVTRVPIAALFRRGADWHVFRVLDGKAVMTKVTIGHRNSLVAEVLEGLAPGEVVVLHPSDRINDQVGVEPRDAG
jgi:HlyD family secretion protein